MALKYANSAIGLGKEKITDEIFYTLGSTYHRLGNLDTAIINYQLALDKLPALRSSDLLIKHQIEQCTYAQELLKAEENLMSNFNDKMYSLNPIIEGYLDMTKLKAEFIFSDGVHLHPSSGKKSSSIIANWITNK